jgi:predicted RNA binding protein YcfA (HicA-like mRNA interferase family)
MGFELVRVKGDHGIYRKKGTAQGLTIPIAHPTQAPGTLNSIKNQILGNR